MSRQATVIPLVRAFIAVVLTALAAALLGALLTRHAGAMLSLDRRVALDATDITRRHPALLAALKAWQGVFHPLVVYLVVAPVVAWVWRRGARERALWGGPTMLVCWNLGFQIKLLVRRARPVIPEPVGHSPGYSFPSGHAFNLTMMTATCLVMAWPLLVGRLAWMRRTVPELGVIVVLFTALDRVFLGVHFLSDVIAGIVIAMALCGASSLAGQGRLRNDSVRLYMYERTENRSATSEGRCHLRAATRQPAVRSSSPPTSSSKRGATP